MYHTYIWNISHDAIGKDYIYEIDISWFQVYNEKVVNGWKPYGMNINSKIQIWWEFIILYVVVWIIIIYKKHDS